MKKLISLLLLAGTVAASAQSGFRNSAGNVLPFVTELNTNDVITVGTTGSPISPTNKNVRIANVIRAANKMTVMPSDYRTNSATTVGFGRSETNFSTVVFVNLTNVICVDRGFGFPPVNIAVKDLLRATNQVVYMGDFSGFSSLRPTEPAYILFSDTVHGAHGVVWIGANSGDVVISATANDGIVQIGSTGNPGARMYLQYASVPNAGTNTGHSHPLGFRSLSWNGSATVYHQPGLAGFTGSDVNDTNGILRLYAHVPYWNFSNQDPNNPNEPGLPVADVNKQGIALFSGMKFYGDGSALTNISLSGGTGLTTNFYTSGAFGDIVLQCYYAGSLTQLVYGLESESVAYFSAVTNSGGTLTTAQRSAVDLFVKRRKGIIGRHVGVNTFSDADRIALFLGGTASTTTNYLKGTGGIVWQNGPTYSAAGVLFDGVNDYGQTGFNASSGTPNYVQNSARMIVVLPQSSATNYALNASFTGATSGANRAGIYSSGANVISATGINNATGPGPNVVPFEPRGVYIGTRTASNAEALYFWRYNTPIGDPVTDDMTDTTASAGVPNDEWYIGARNNGGPSNYGVFTLSAFELGAGVDATTAQYIRDDYAELQRDLSR